MFVFVKCYSCVKVILSLARSLKIHCKFENNAERNDLGVPYCLGS